MLLETRPLRRRDEEALGEVVEIHLNGKEAEARVLRSGELSLVADGLHAILMFYQKGGEVGLFSLSLERVAGGFVKFGCRTSVGDAKPESISQAVPEKKDRVQFLSDEELKMWKDHLSTDNPELWEKLNSSAWSGKGI